MNTGIWKGGDKVRLEGVQTPRPPPSGYAPALHALSHKFGVTGGGEKSLMETIMESMVKVMWF